MNAALLTFLSMMVLFSVIQDMLYTSKIIWNNKFFKGTRVMGEVLYHDSVSMGRNTCDVTVVNCKLNGKSIDVLIPGNRGQKAGTVIGEKIEIITDGEIAFCVQRNWRNINPDYGNLKGKITIGLLFGGLAYLYLIFEPINIYFLVFSILINVILIARPLRSYRNLTYSLKSASGWHENL